MTACRGKEALHTWKDKPASWANCAHRPTGSRRAPAGDSWYDSLQMKLNMRLKYGFSALATYTLQKSLTRITNFDNWTAFNTQKALDANDIPRTLSPAPPLNT